MKHPESSREWNEAYRGGLITIGEFFEGLIYCVKFQEPNVVLSVLNDDERRQFKSLIADFADIRDFNELMRIGNPPNWGRSEIDKLVGWANRENK